MQRVNGHYGQETHPQVVRRDLNVWGLLARRATQLRIEEFRRTDGSGTLGMDESVIEAVKKGTSASGQKSQNIDAESLGIRRSKFKAYEVLLNISRILSYISDHGCENDG